MAEFILFGTEGCHLCEEAEAVLVATNVVYRLEDIMDDSDWQEKFGLLIPVLWDVESQRQLNWPFDFEKVKNFVVMLGGSPKRALQLLDELDLLTPNF